MFFCARVVDFSPSYFGTCVMSCTNESRPGYRYYWGLNHVGGGGGGGGVKPCRRAGLTVWAGLA